MEDCPAASLHQASRSGMPLSLPGVFPRWAGSRYPPGLPGQFNFLQLDPGEKPKDIDIRLLQGSSVLSISGRYFPGVQGFVGHQKATCTQAYRLQVASQVNRPASRFPGGLDEPCTDVFTGKGGPGLVLDQFKVRGKRTETGVLQAAGRSPPAQASPRGPRAGRFARAGLGFPP